VSMMNFVKEIATWLLVVFDAAQLTTKSFQLVNSQVMKMAKELAKLHRAREAQRHQATEDRLRLESQAVAAIVKSQCQKAREDRLELQRLKKHLSLLQLREQKSLPAPQEYEISPGRPNPTVIHQSSPPGRKSDLPKPVLAGVDKCKDGAEAPSGLQIFQVCSMIYFRFACCNSYPCNCVTSAHALDPRCLNGQKQLG